MNTEHLIKSCIVAGCGNTSVKTPNKRFVKVPYDLKTRAIWFSILRPGERFLPLMIYHCCQDHFDFAGNMSVERAVHTRPLDPQVVTKMSCNNTVIKLKRIRSSGSPDTDSWKLVSKKTPWTSNSIVNDIGPPPKLTRISNLTRQIQRDKEKSTSGLNAPYICVLREKQNMVPDRSTKLIVPKNLIKPSVKMQRNSSTMPPEIIKPEFIDPPVIKEEILEDVTIFENFSDKIWKNSEDIRIHSSITNSPYSLSNTKSIEKPSNVLRQNLNQFVNIDKTENFVSSSQDNIKVQLPKFFSKIKPVMVDAACQCSIEPTKVDRSCSPIKSILSIELPKSIDIFNTKKAVHLIQKLKKEEYSSTQNRKKREIKHRKKEEILAAQIQKSFASFDIQRYLGIPSNKLSILGELHKYTKCSINDIKLTLLIIRMNEPFSKMAQEFNISIIQAILVFNKTVDLLASYLKKYIFTPSLNSMNKNLPKAFSSKLTSVCVFINTFEVDIEKPLDPLNQSKSSSESKKFCTLKYLISCTPNGFINFVSSGHSSARNDQSFIRESKIIKALPKKCAVVTNKKFEKINVVLQKKECQLISLPEVPDDFEILEGMPLFERYLRHNFSNTIKRIQEYKILAPNAGLDESFMARLDNIVTVVAALMNL